MYKQDKITIQKLLDQKLTKEKSARALRARADEKILVFLEFGEDGRTRFYDRQLSIVRANAANLCRNRNPKTTWGILKRAFERLDSKNPALNKTIINLLNNDLSEREAAQAITEIILTQLRENGHLN